MTPFASILREVVERTPGAVGGAFAARDGEMVDSFARPSEDDWAFLTAHYGVLLAQVQSALNTLHYGEAEAMTIEHTGLDILVHAVAEGYFALLAVDHPAPLAAAEIALERAVVAIRREMY